MIDGIMLAKISPRYQVPEGLVERAAWLHEALRESFVSLEAGELYIDLPTPSGMILCLHLTVTGATEEGCKTK